MKKISREYTQARTKKGVQSLEFDIHLPEGEGPSDLLVWMHSGGFRSGSRTHPAHDRIAAAFGAHGIATAFIDYRLARSRSVLTTSVAAQLKDLVADAEQSGEEMTKTFYGPRALAVVEDCCAFLNKVENWKTEFRLSGRYLLGGSSAGAISALNTLYLAPKLGILRPKIDTVFAFSGGFAYSSSLHTTGARVLAQHNENDDKVPISSIRRLASMAPDPFLLIESEVSKHGDIKLMPEEPLETVVARCVAFDRALDINCFDINLVGQFPGYQVTEK